MSYAAITGWGKCCPPATLTNQDLAQIMETSDEWIRTRTGMQERRVSHVSVAELATVACHRALAAAGKTASDIDLIVFGSTTFSQMCPNTASFVQKELAAHNAACIDLNTACTSGMYALSVASAMLKTGSIKSALVIGAEVITPLLDWSYRDTAVLFGDGATALYIEESESEAGVLAESLGCYGQSRDVLDVKGWGLDYAFNGKEFGLIDWTFDGREIFKQAVNGMESACQSTLHKKGLSLEDIKLVIPHQANLRIIEALGKKLSVPSDKVYINIHRYANMSAATTTMALIEALEEKRFSSGDLLLLPAFGGGLTWSSHLIRWGERIEPVNTSSAELPPCNQTALEMVQGFIKRQTKAKQNL